MISSKLRVLPLALPFLALSFSGSTFAHAAPPLKVLRYRDPQTNLHAFSTDAGSERRVPDFYKRESIPEGTADSPLFYLLTEPHTGTIPLFRFRTANGGMRFVANDEERKQLRNHGLEELAQPVYVYKEPVEGATELFRLIDPQSSDIVYTTSNAERSYYKSRGWRQLASLGYTQSTSSTGTGILLPATVKLDADDLALLAKPTTDGAKLVFSKTNKKLSSLTVGSFLYAEASDVLPLGLVARVVSVSSAAAGPVVIDTAPARLSDVFSEFHLYIDNRPISFPANIASSAPAARSPLASTARSTQSFDHLADFLKPTYLTNSAQAESVISGTWSNDFNIDTQLTHESGFSIELKCGLSLSVTGEVDLNYSLTNVSGTVLFTPVLSGNATATLGLPSLLSADDIDLITPVSGNFVVGGIPVTVSAGLVGGFNIGGQINGTLTGNATARATGGFSLSLGAPTDANFVACPNPCPSGFSCGVNYSGGPTCSLTASGTASISIDNGNTASVYVEPKISLGPGLSFGGVGADATVSFGMKNQLDAELGSTGIDVYYQLGPELEAGIQFGPWTWDPAMFDFPQASVEIYRFAFPALTVTPNSLDFGTVKTGSSSTLSFTVQNTGGGTLSGGVSGVSTPFSVISGGSYSIGAGQSQTVKVKFAPTTAQAFMQAVNFSGGGGATGSLTGIGQSTVGPTAHFTMSAGGQSVHDGETLYLSVPQNGNINVSFSSTSTQNSAAINTYVWKSNGTQICGNSASCTYNFGTQSNTITLAVTDANGNTSTATGLVYLNFQSGQGPTAHFTMSAGGQTLNDGQTLYLNVPVNGNVNVSFASTSKQGTAAINTYVWKSNGTQICSNSASCAFSFGTLSNTITLTVTDANGNTSTATGLVYLNFQSAQGPTSHFTMSGGSSSANDGQTLYLSVPVNGSINVNFSSTSTQASAPISSYEWKSNGTQICSNSSSCNYTFGTQSNTITLTVTDANGNTSTATGLVYLNFQAAQGPTAHFTMSGGGGSANDGGTLTLTAGSAVSFTSTATQGAAAINSYVWKSNGIQICSGSSCTISFGASTDTVSLTVTDANGNSSTASGTLVVTSPASGIAAFGASTHSVTAGDSVTFTVTLSAITPSPTIVYLTSSDNSVLPGGSIPIAAGSNSGTGLLTSTTNLTQSGSAVITASLGGISFPQTQTITVNPITGTPAIAEFFASTNSVTAGGSVSFAVGLSSKAPPGTTVNLTSSATSALPNVSIPIPAGSYGAGILVTSSSVTQSTNVVVTASVDGIQFPQTQTITVNPVSVRPGDFVWKNDGVAPGVLCEGAASVVLNNLIYVFGVGQYCQAYQFDPAANTWTPLPAMPSREYQGGAAAINGKIYVLNGPVYGGQLQIYDPATNQWTTGAKPPIAQPDPAVATVNGYMYVIGSFDDAEATVVLQYDPVSNSWSQKASMPTPRGLPTAAVLDGIIYVIGGRTQNLNGGAISAAVEAYDPVQDAWTEGESMIDRPRFAMGSAILNNKLYLIGGSDNGPDALATVQEFDPSLPIPDSWSENQWRDMNSILTARHSPVAANVNGTIYVIGGNDGNDVGLTSIEEGTYNPAVTPTVTMTPGSTSITIAQDLSEQVTVSAPPGATTPTGVVVINGGGYTSQSQPLSGGATKFDIPAGKLAVGTNTLTATYTPDSNSTSSYLTSSQSLSVTVSKAPSFALINGSAIAVVAGNSGTSALTVTPSNGFTGQVNFACSASGSPAGLTCTAPTVSVTGPSAATSILTVATTAATPAGNYTGTVTASDAATGKITSSTTASIKVNAPPTVTAWPTASAITYGQTLSSSTLSGGTASIPGTFSWSTPAIVPGAGTPSEIVTFTPTDATDYSPVTGSVSVTVNKATPTVTAWPTPTSIVFGQTLSSSTLTGGAASVAGTFSWANLSTQPAVGTQSEIVTFTPNDAADYVVVSGSVNVTVNNPVPVVASLSPAIAKAGDAGFSLTVNGMGFMPNSTIYWGPSALMTQYTSATTLKAQVPASDVATAGTAAISVQTPTPGGGVSNALTFQIDSASSGATPPTFTTITATVNPGATASYSVTLPASVTSASVTCLNLPSGASCSYSSTTGAVSIATSSSTPAGTYQITVVFAETLPGAVSAFVFLPILLLPIVGAGRKFGLRKRFLFVVCLAFVISSGAVVVGCGGGGGGGNSTQPQTHTVTSSGTVTLTVQ